MEQPMDACNNMDVSGRPRQTSPTGRRLPTAAEIGRRRTQEFLSDVFESPTKSRRLEIANQIKTLEREYSKTGNRARKRKQQIRELTAALEEDETRYAQLDEQIRTLKSENATE